MDYDWTSAKMGKKTRMVIMSRYTESGGRLTRHVPGHAEDVPGRL